jgi:hypothetical protein
MNTMLCHPRWIKGVTQENEMWDHTPAFSYAEAPFGGTMLLQLTMADETPPAGQT